MVTVGTKWYPLVMHGIRCYYIGVGTGGAQGARVPPIFLVYCEMVLQSTDLD